MSLFARISALPVRADGLGEARTANDLTQVLRDWLVVIKSTPSVPGEKASHRPLDPADDARESPRFVF